MNGRKLSFNEMKQVLGIIFLKEIKDHADWLMIFIYGIRLADNFNSCNLIG